MSAILVSNLSKTDHGIGYLVVFDMTDVRYRHTGRQAAGTQGRVGATHQSRCDWNDLRKGGGNTSVAYIAMLSVGGVVDGRSLGSERA